MTARFGNPLPGSEGSQILEFPAATTELLRHAQAGSTLAAVIADFERRGIGVAGFSAMHVVETGITMLESKGLLRGGFGLLSGR